MVPLSNNFKNNKNVAGIKIDIFFDDQRFLFNVSSRVETQTEMQCVSGYVQRSVYDACAKQGTEYFYDYNGNMRSRSTGCQGGYVMRSIYDPCVRKVPVTKSKVVIDPETGIAQGKATASFALQQKHFSKKSVPLNMSSYLLKDSKGKVLKSHGEVLK